MTNVEALQALYVALGGDAANIANASTSVEVLNAIAAKYGGDDDATLNPEAIANIAAVADNIGGGGSDPQFASLIDGSITDLVIPEGVTSIRPSAFNACTYLTTVTIPDSVTTMGIWAFQDCTSLRAVNIPSGIGEIPTGLFYSCRNLLNIEIPSSVENINGDMVFAGCDKLTTITINKPEGSIEGAPWGAPNATVIWTG